MSHKVLMQTEVRVEAAVAEACKRLQLNAPVRGTHHLYQGPIEGLGVNLRNWNYPVVFNTENGQAQYDNMDGAWGEQERLDEFLQVYGVEAVRHAVRSQGMSVEEHTGVNDSIILEITEYV